MKRIYDVTRELKAAAPELKFVMSGLTYTGVTALDEANDALEAGVADLAGFGRMTFAYPTFYREWRETGGLSPKKVCLACGKCSELMRAGTVAGCPVRDAEVYLPYYNRFVR